MRGNLPPPVQQQVLVRSIPASAGQPPSRRPTSIMGEVYPRECGATIVSASQKFFVRGLSPRVRGNPETAQGMAHLPRSIPASAGQPRMRQPDPSLGRVYPRECGATIDEVSEVFMVAVYPRECGQPQHPYCRPYRPPVYPRECGATYRDLRFTSAFTGLSPRVLGNHRCHLVTSFNQRSIPASAGQPSYSTHRDLHQRVYPRECGATIARTGYPVGAPGLSPRVRGNLQCWQVPWVSYRSIPASAGQPGDLY